MPAKRKQAAPKAEEAALLDEGGTVDDAAEDDSNDEAAEAEEEGDEYDVEEGDFMADRGEEDEGDEDDEEDGDDDEEAEDDEDNEDEEEEEDDEDDEDEDDEDGDDEDGEDGTHRSMGDLWDEDAEGDDEDDEDEEEEEPAKEVVKAKPGQKATVAGSANRDTLSREKPSDRKKLTLRGRRAVREPKEGEIIPESDSEEDGPIMRNPVGKIPMEWYRDEKHIGYDLQGKKIIRKPKKDALDRHLDKADDPQSWRTVYDEVNDEELRLTDAEVKLLTRLRAGKFDPGYNPYEDYPKPYDAPEHKIHPLSNRPEPKSRFVPSKHEAKKIVKYVRMIRAGKVLRPPPKKQQEDQYNYDVWEAENDTKFRGAVPIPAPKPKLPGHAESYNPPEEYLLSKEEEEEMMKHDPADRPLNFIPRKYDAFRKVPLYDRLLNERFERCLDLYLCPRTVKKRMNVDPQSLLPSLPKPQELKPYPSTLAVVYEGHTDKVHSLAMHPAGQYFASCSSDGSVRVWEIASGRCHRKWDLGASVACVAWNPNPATSIIAAAVGDECVLLDMTLGEGALEEGGAAIAELLKVGREAKTNRGQIEGKKEVVTWSEPTSAEQEKGVLLKIAHSKPLIQVAWHHKGDYLVTLAPTANSRAVLIHQMSKMQSQNPFTKSKADARKVLFHPSKPFLFVATRSHVKIYNLQKQTLAKSLIGGFKMLSSFDIHPGGDNVVCSSVDRRMSWFDMDLSTKPYKTLRYNNTGLRSISMHKKLPLFAAGGEDGVVYVFHGMVYQDLMQNPFIVPLKRLHAHKCDKFDGVLDAIFHPTQPWLFTCGVDQTVRMFTER